MASTTFPDVDHKHQCHFQFDQHRYENLKSSTAILRSRFRSTPAASPCPSSPSSTRMDLVPLSNYFSATGAHTTTTDRSRSSCLINQIEACSLLESYAMQALRLDCETRLKEGQNELEKIREKLKDKVRRTELFDRELEKQRRKLEGRIKFLSEHCKTLEMQLAEQSVHHKEELKAVKKACAALRKQEEEEQTQQTKKIISDYEDSVAAMQETSATQLAKVKRLEQELSMHLEQMEKNKHSSEDQIKYLTGQLELVFKQSESFKTSYEEQEREWNMKLQHITAIHQYQTRIITEDFSFQIEKLKKEIKVERDQHDSKLQAYKAQKLDDMENIEKQVKGVLEMKDAIIAELKLQLKMLHQQVNDSTSIQDEHSA